MKIKAAGQLIALCLVFFTVIPMAAVSVGKLAAGEGFQWIYGNREINGGADTGKEGQDEGPEANISKVKLPSKIKVWREDEGRAVSVDFEEYVTCVAASEMPSSFEKEALKAQSVAARTFAVSKLEKYEQKKPTSHPEAALCSSTHCQVYKTEEELIACHPDGWGTSDEGFPKIKEACRETEGELLYYDGELVMQPLFFSSSGGWTENSEDVFVSAVPYLVSVSSPYEEGASHQNEEKSFTLEDFRKKIREAYPDKAFGSIDRENIRILSRTAGGRVSEMQIGDVNLKGTEVRNALGLSSALFSLSFSEESGSGGSPKETKIVFTSNGSGHGVGMSQYGANGMAKQGADYRKILTYYYSGTQVA